MQQHVQYLASEYATQKGDAERAAKEADDLREGMESFRESAVVRPLFRLSLPQYLSFSSAH